MGGDMLDFDRFLAEKREAFLTVKVYGEEYRVKKEIPALVPVLLARCGEAGDARERGQVMLRAGDLIFGPEAIDGFCRRGMTAEELGQLIERVFEMILGEDGAQEIDDDGPAEKNPAK